MTFTWPSTELDLDLSLTILYVGIRSSLWVRRHRLPVQFGVEKGCWRNRVLREGLGWWKDSSLDKKPQCFEWWQWSWWCSGRQIGRPMLFELLTFIEKCTLFGILLEIDCTYDQPVRPAVDRGNAWQLIYARQIQCNDPNLEFWLGTTHWQPIRRFMCWVPPKMFTCLRGPNSPKNCTRINSRVAFKKPLEALFLINTDIGYKFFGSVKELKESQC